MMIEKLNNIHSKKSGEITDAYNDGVLEQCEALKYQKEAGNIWRQKVEEAREAYAKVDENGDE